MKKKEILNKALASAEKENFPFDRANRRKNIDIPWLLL